MPSIASGEGAFVPWPVVAAAVDEEGWGDDRAARLRALLVGVDPGFRALVYLFVRAAIGRDAEVGRDRHKVVFGQRQRPRHQLDMRVPSNRLGGRRANQFGRAPRELDAHKRTMAEDIAQPIPEIVAYARKPFVGGAANGQA